MDYSTKQAARLLRAARQDIMALQQMPDPAVSYDIKAASHHARRAYNALDTLKSCLHMSTAKVLTKTERDKRNDYKKKQPDAHL